MYISLFRAILNAHGEISSRGVDWSWLWTEYICKKKKNWKWAKNSWKIAFRWLDLKKQWKEAHVLCLVPRCNSSPNFPSRDRLHLSWWGRCFWESHASSDMQVQAQKYKKHVEARAQRHTDTQAHIHIVDDKDEVDRSCQALVFKFWKLNRSIDPVQIESQSHCHSAD